MDRNIIIRFLVFIFLFSTLSCHAQRMVQTVNDAKKLQLNEKEFIGQPLKVLLAQIVPEIKSAIGNPEDIGSSQSSFIYFYFVDKKDGLKRFSNGEKPTSIYVVLQKRKNKNYPPIIPANPWTEEQTEIYGDMIIMKVLVSGEH